MCGVFGFIVDGHAGLSRKSARAALLALATAAESRGKDSSGIVFRFESDRTMRVFKGSVSITELFTSRDVLEGLGRALRSFGDTGADAGSGMFMAMGHSRLVTNGSQLKGGNNQPVVKDGIIGIHNGIIVNDGELWKRHSDLARDNDIDTEVMLALTRKYVSEGHKVTSAASKAIGEVFGTVSTAMYFGDTDQLVLATNNGSLYTLARGDSLFAFASERYHLEHLRQTVPRFGRDGQWKLAQVVPGSGVLVELGSLRRSCFPLIPTADRPSRPVVRSVAFRIETMDVANGRKQREVVLDVGVIGSLPAARAELALLEYNIERIRALRRCSKCLLPETFPFIEYDENGVCNYCRHYRLKNQPKPIEQLFGMVEPYRSRDGSPDCVVPYSGGRDSSFTLHVVKNVLKLNPIAFTYDWGMVTDLGRRNIARVCGKLAVENIIVAANIHWKRENIRRNILAWLKQPHLGMVPLFMAGDKFFFYYTDKVRRQTGIRLNIWGINPLENTDFKVGFLGVPPDHDKTRIYSLSKGRQAVLFANIGGIVARNPAYLNRSIFDTLGSYLSRYIGRRSDYHHMFDYYRWDEKEIEDLLLKEYRWETATDTKTTWRIGDGTAAFYNYIYFTVAGFSEYDTFRSNQIREGAISRAQGLRLVEVENQPRYATMKWYTEIVGIDFESAVKTINSIPKLYP